MLREIEKSLASGDTYNAFYRIALPGKEPRSFHARAAVERDADGAPVRFVGTIWDRTNQRRLEEQLLQAQKMETVGNLVGGIAHDFNNLLTVILGNTELLIDRLFDDSAVPLELGQILEASHHARDLVRQLLIFGSRQTPDTLVVDLVREVRTFERLARRVLRGDVVLEVETSDAPCHARLDPVQLEQVLLNLIVNAQDAMPDGGELSDPSDRERCTSRIETVMWPAHLRSQSRDRMSISMSVADTGAPVWIAGSDDAAFSSRSSRPSPARAAVWASRWSTASCAGTRAV